MKVRSFLICPKPARESKAVETDFWVGAYSAAGGDNELLILMYCFTRTFFYPRASHCSAFRFQSLIMNFVSVCLFVHSDARKSLGKKFCAHGRYVVKLGIALMHSVKTPNMCFSLKLINNCPNF